jgi:hypothetical protein
LQYTIYAVVLPASISTWFIVFCAPLWLDETVSMYSGGRPHADARGLRDRGQRHLAPLSCYKLSVPVAPLPRALNEEAVRAGSAFLQQEAQRRFLALAFVESYPTLDWLRNKAAETHDVRELGVFDGVKVLEFVPRDQADASQ